MSTFTPGPPDIVEHPPDTNDSTSADDLIESLPNPSRLLPRPRRPSIVTSIASSHGELHTGKSWAESVGETAEDAWLPLILTLDGGGIRGYSSLLIIERLMQEVAKWETYFEELEQPDASNRKTFNACELLPAHYFDYMYGTSTGGLIATMLGRLRMNVPDCLRYYKIVGDSLFAHRRNILPLATKYHHKPLEKAVKEIVSSHCPIHPDSSCDGNDWYPWHLDSSGEEPLNLEPYGEDSVERICQSICLTATHNNRITEAYLLRTYNHIYTDKKPFYVVPYNSGADKLKIWQVTRATSAAPFYFKSLVADMQNEKRIFKDGGIRENNPSVAAWIEFLSLYGDQKEPALLLSIGTGVPNMENDGFGETWPGPWGHLKAVKKIAETFAVFKNVLVKYTQGEQTHQAMVRHAKGEWNWYKRLNVDSGLQNMKLDNWENSVEYQTSTDSHGRTTTKKVTVPGGKTLKTMEDVTNTYLSRERYDSVKEKKKHDALNEYAAPKVMLVQAAEKMVRHRRARERAAEEDPQRWEWFMGRRLRVGTGVSSEGEVVVSEER